MDGFDQATSNVEPTAADKSTASAAHTEVREALEQDDVLKSWGIDSVLIGSYRRQVSIRRINDVDVFCRLPNVPADTTGNRVLEVVGAALVSAFGQEAVTSQARSWSVELPKWRGLHVDAVPARPAGSHWEIPMRTQGWERTNPERLTELSSRMNEKHDDRYVPSVKLLRQTRRVIIGDHPGGLFVEAALYDQCARGFVGGSTQRERYVSALGGVANVLSLIVDSGFQIPNPAVPGDNYIFRASPEEWRSARDAFDAAATQARKALTAPRCEAEATFHRLLGSNSDGEIVYPLPSDCNLDGTSKSTIVPGDTTVAGGSQRFAANGP